MKLIPKLQTAWSTIKQDNTRVQRPLILQPIKRKLKSGEQFFNNNGRIIVAKPKEEYIQQDNRDVKQKEDSHKQSVQTRKEEQTKKAEQHTTQVFEKLLDEATLVPTFERVIGEELSPAGKFAASFVLPTVALKGAQYVGKGLNYAGKAANYAARMGMPALGYAPSTRYYFNPGYAGMNWFGLKKSPKVVQSQVVAEQPKTNPLDLITQSERFGEGYKQITLEDLQNLAQERIGRNLTNQELKDYIGHRKILLPDQEELLGFAPRNRDFSKEGYFVLEDNDLSEALSNFNKFTDKGTIRTKLGNERYTEKEIQSMLDENGNLKSNVALQRMYPGEHGVSNWYDRGDQISDKAVKYFKTKYDTGAQMGILRDNPYDRSGVLIRPEDYEYSFDSFDVALNYLDRALGKKQKSFYKLNPKTTHVQGNNYGQLKRYEEIDFDPEFSELLKSNRGELPDGAAVYANKDNGNLIIKYGGRKVGTLRPRTTEEIIKEYKPIIDNLNNKYNLNIDYPKLNQYGKIEWPNIYGILYKHGGAINFFKYKHSKFFENHVSNNI